MKRKLTTEEFTQRSNVVHHHFYNYDLVTYINGVTKVEIVCPKHGKFLQKPEPHLQGAGCPVCGHIKGVLAETHNTNMFIGRARKIHNDVYDYSSVNYIAAKLPVTIICKIHGPFQQLPSKHLYGRGCSKCGLTKMSKSKTSNLDTFISKLTEAHHEFNTYESSIYVTAKTHMNVNCRKHGLYQVSPDNHLRGRGCPTCAASKGEMIISLILKELKIKFKTEVRFSDCKNKKPLPFDFGIYRRKKLIGLIEFQGIQHFKPISHWGGDKSLQACQERDKIKKEYCKLHNIPLLEVPYVNINNYDNIKTFLHSIQGF